MIISSSGRWQRLSQLTGRASTVSLPAFLVPAIALRSSNRSFSATIASRSKIGRAPLSLPPEVTLQVIEPLKSKGNGRKARVQPNQMVEVQGPLGKISMPISPFIEISRESPSASPVLKISDRNERHQREMWGTTRAYLQNHILGVSEGHTVILRLVGVGYRATVEPTATTKSPEYPGQEFVSLKVGYSHPIELGVPRGVKVSTPQPTRILLEGIDKEVVNQFAAEIRMWRKPEPYKGKGIFKNDERITLKSKKIK